MSTIAHISDLHFGKTHTHMEEPLRTYLAGFPPKLITVSGDITQRAKRKEFHAAKEFFDSLPAPTLVVPGNHDVLWHNPIERIFFPLKRFKRYIHKDPEPLYVDDNLLIMGINTAHGKTTQYGKVHLYQLLRIEQYIHTYPQRTNIIVSHHPFHVENASLKHHVVTGSSRIANILVRSGVDIFLFGHFHTFHSDAATLTHEDTDMTSLMIHAGTSLSTRTRKEHPSFNLITVTHPLVTVDHVIWRDDIQSFAPENSYRFLKKDTTWKMV